MTTKRKSTQPNSPPSGAPWIWQTASLLASPAWRGMSINARRALDRIMLEHMAHAGTENGNLLVTHRQFIAAGVSRDYVADAIDELCRGNAADVILDARSVSLMDSAALEVLVRARRALEERGGSLKIIGMSDVCRDILLVTRLLNEFQVHDDLHKALKGVPGP